MSSPYLDKYSALYEKNYGYDPNDTSTGEDYDPSGDWDQGFDTATDYDEMGNWNGGEDTANFDQAMDAGDPEWDDPSYQGEDLAEDPLAKTQAPVLTQTQQRRLERLQKKRAELETNFQETQGEFYNLEQGQASPEEKSKQLEEVRKELDRLMDDLEDVEELENKLNKDGVQSDDGMENDPLLGNDPEFDEMLADSDSSNEIRENIEEMKSGLEEETIKVDKEMRGQEIQAELNELQTEEIQNGEELQAKLVDALGYLNGSKDRQYFVGKVSDKARGKHIYKHYPEPTAYATEVIGTMGAAALSGDWEPVKTMLDGIQNNWVDDTVGLLHTVLSNHYPEVMNALPADVAQCLHDNGKRGDHPGDKGIHYLFGRSLKYGPKSAKRRRDMEQVNTSYASAADAFLALSKSKQGPEDAKQKRIEELQKELNELGLDTYPEWEDSPIMNDESESVE